MDGILLINKPAGPTSHDIVDFIRKKFGIKKVGHAGTLDPFAEGLLIILLGNATKKQIQYMMDNKSYIASIKLGISTDTGDLTGKSIFESKKELPNISDIQNILTEFIGHINQNTPMYSAIKFKGKPLYKLARKNINLTLPPRKIEIKKIEILSYKKPFLEILVNCSKGTYIRQLCHDIGEKLGCGAHAVKLKRIASGNLDIKDALEFEALEKMSEEDLQKQIIK